MEYGDWNERGVDVSEHNGPVDWTAVRAAGMDFAVIRLGYGRRHLDGRFVENLEGAAAAGLAAGVYYYSYALDEAMARAEAAFLTETLAALGLGPGDLPRGVWLDMEDADGYKGSRGVTEAAELTGICGAFLAGCRREGFENCGLYASYDWLENRLYMDRLVGVPVWCAQWDAACDWPGAALWQYTSGLAIGGRVFDGNLGRRTG